MKRKTTKVDLPQLQLRALIVPGSLNEEDRTVDLVIATDAPIVEWDGTRGQYVVRTLDISVDSIRPERLDKGLATLWHHDRHSLRALLGRGCDWWIEKNELFIKTRITSEHEDADLAWRMLKDGTLTDASCGFRVYASEEIAGDHEDGRIRTRATDFEIFEATLTSVGEDASGGTRSADSSDLTSCIITRALEAPETDVKPKSKTTPNQYRHASAVTTLCTDAGLAAAFAQGLIERSLSPEQASDEIAAHLASQDGGDQYRHAAEVTTLCADAGLDASFAQGLIERSLNVEQASEEIATHLAAQNDPANYRHAAEVTTLCADQGLEASFAQDLITRSLDPEQARSAIADHLASRDNGTHVNNQVRVGQSDLEKRSLAIGNALAHRVDPSGTELDDGGRHYRGLRMQEIGRELLEQRGINTRGMGTMELAERALHVGSDLANVIGVVARRSLRMAHDNASQSFMRWARQVTLPDFRATERIQFGGLGLQKLNEKGEIKSGKLADGKTAIKLESFGEKVGYTRQMYVNDDLDALGRIPQMWGYAKARLENSLVYGLITGNAKTGDGKALFDASHKNTGAGVIDVTGLSTGRTKMAVHPAFGNDEAMNLQPGFLLVPSALQTVAQQHVASGFVPGSSGEVNPFAGNLEVISEALLDADSALKWYLIVGNGQYDTVEYGYLEGSNGLDLRVKEGFDIDGIELRVTHDFGVALMGHEGIYRSTGA